MHEKVFFWTKVARLDNFCVLCGVVRTMVLYEQTLANNNLAFFDCNLWKMVQVTLVTFFYHNDHS